MTVQEIRHLLFYSEQNIEIRDDNTDELIWDVTLEEYENTIRSIANVYNEFADRIREIEQKEVKHLLADDYDTLVIYI